MSTALDYTFTRTWWTYSPPFDEFSRIYHGFNIFEGCVWVVLAALVGLRYLGQRKSVLEPLYAFAFFTFGLTDFREAYAMQSWLIWLKAVNLGLLLYLRWLVIRRFYPASSLY